MILLTTEQAGGRFFKQSYTIQEMFGNRLLIITTLEKTLQVLVINMTKLRDAFIEPKPYPSWTLNETTCHMGSTSGLS